MGSKIDFTGIKSSPKEVKSPLSQHRSFSFIVQPLVLRPKWSYNNGYHHCYSSAVTLENNFTLSMLGSISSKWHRTMV